MSHSRFYSSLLLLILLNVIIKPLWIFGIDRQVQNITGANEYGTYFSLLNLSIVFSFLLDWGLSSYINRELSAQKSELKHQLGNMIALKILFAFIYAILIIAIAFFTGVKRWDIVWGVIAIQFLSSIFVFLRYLVTANQWFHTDAWLSVFDKTLMILVCGLFIAGPDIAGSINIDRFILAQIACTFMAVLLVVFVLLKRGVAFKKPDRRFINKGLFIAVLPFALNGFFMAAHLRLDGFMLERINSNGSYEAGIYAGAYRLLDASNMMGYLVASFLMPFAARLWSENKNLNEIIVQSRHLLMMFTVAVVITAITMAPWLEEILYHRTDAHSSSVFQWTLASLIGYSLVQIYGTILTAADRIGIFLRLNLFAMILNVILNILLIPTYGAMGCAIAAFCSQILLGVACLAYVHKNILKSFDWRSIGVYAITAAALYAAVYLLQQQSMNSWIILSSIAVLTIIIIRVSRLISLNTWLSFLKKQ